MDLKAVSQVDVQEKVFLSPVFTVPKLERGKEYGRRFILNLKPFNKRFMDKSPFTMPGVYEVADIIHQGYWAVKIDLQNGKVWIF